MKEILTKISKSRFPYEPLITVKLKKQALFHNLDEFGKLAPNNNIAPVLKSNAYGHGLFEIADMVEQYRNSTKTGSKANVPFIVVDSYFEAVALRSHGIKSPILIIGYTPIQTIITSTLKGVSFTVVNIQILRELSKINKPSFFHRLFSGEILSNRFPKKIHLKLDTGMKRQGILCDELEKAIALIKNTQFLKVEGICSHLCDADNTDESFTSKQISIWNSAISKITKEIPDIKYKHLSNTDGHMFTSKIDANVSRLGIGLYGIPDGKSSSANLKPVLEMETVLSGIKTIHKGDTVGYSNTFRADREMIIGTIPVGYYEGLDRRLSNKGKVAVGEQHTICNILGRVSMNITIIDVTHATNPGIGTKVQVISSNQKDPNSFFNMAKVCGTITYENAIKIPPNLKRIVI